MQKVVLALFVPLAAAAAPAAAGDTDPAPPRKELKVLATVADWRSFSSGNGQRGGRVISSAEELAVSMGKPLGKAKEATEQAARVFKVKDIDFGKQMIVVLYDGPKRSGGYGLSVEGVTAEGGQVKVKWKVNPPKGFATQAITHPGVAVLVERAKGKAVFDPPFPAAKK